MNDLDIAKTNLYRRRLTLIIVKNGVVIFETDSHRISGFLLAVEQFGVRLKDSSVADRVVGKAIALLCVYAGIREIYAEVLSREAQAVLDKNGIGCHCKELVDNILDLNHNAVCPFEKAATCLSDPEVAYATFKELLESLKSCK